MGRWDVAFQKYRLFGTLLPGKALEFLRCSSYSTTVDEVVLCFWPLAYSSQFQNAVTVNEKIWEWTIDKFSQNDRRGKCSRVDIR